MWESFRSNPVKNIISISLVIASIFALFACNDTNIKSDGNVQSKVPELDLLTAIDQYKTEIVKQHMHAGTDPNKNPIPRGIPFEGAYPLHLAVLKGSSGITKILIDSGADIDIKAKNQDEATPLHWAVFFIKDEMVTLLVELGSSINELDIHGGTPLDSGVFALGLNKGDDGNVNRLKKIIEFLKENGGKSAKDL